MGPITIKPTPTTTPTTRPQDRPGKGYISKKNPFRVGDVVEHASSGQRGLVSEVQNDWVKFWVPARTGPGGKKVFLRFNYTKCILLLTGEVALQRARALMAEDAEKAKGGIVKRIATWAKNLVKSNTPAPPATT